MRVLAVDFETSGTDPKVNAPVSLGLAVMEDDQVIASKEWLIGPPTGKNGRISRVYDLCAMEVHRIPWKEIKAAPIARDVLPSIHRWIQEANARYLTRVAYNASFDYGFWQELHYLGGFWSFGALVQPPPSACGPWQCVMDMAKDQLSLKSYSLNDVAGHFGFEREGVAHGALEDAVIAGRVYAQLRKLKESSNG